MDTTHAHHTASAHDASGAPVAPSGSGHDAPDHTASGHAHANHTASGHAGHDHAASGHGPGQGSWSMAARATLHCLTGCAIGEILGLVIGTALGLSTGATIVLAIALAFVFGYALTLTPVLRSGVALKAAIAVTLAADTVSITVMELVDNGVMLVVPGAMDAGLGTTLFWGSLAVSLAVAFVLTVPVNRWLIARGKGHAVVHGIH